MARQLSSPLALEQMLRDNPEDDQLWLVYADWLQDQGDVRGRLIVLEQQRDNRALSIDERDDAGKEADWLLKDYQRSWLTGWRHRVAADLRWKYGFVMGATLPVPEEEDEEDDRVLGLQTLLELPAARFLTEVTLAEPSASELSSLVRLLPGSTIRSLSLSGIGSDSVAALANAAPMPSLIQLALASCRPGPEGVRALANADALPSLRSLGLSSCDLDDEALSALANTPLLARLRTLALQNNRLGDSGMLALASTTLPCLLEELDLSDNYLFDAGVEALARCTAFPALRVLRLYGNQVGDDGALALARSETLRALTELDLSYNQLTEEGTTALTETELYARGTVLLYGGWE